MYQLINNTISAASFSTMIHAIMTVAAGSVCCVAWKDDHQFATASADHVIHLHSGDQACTATLRGNTAADLTQLTWSPSGNHSPSVIVMLFCAGKSACCIACHLPCRVHSGRHALWLSLVLSAVQCELLSANTGCSCLDASQGSCLSCCLCTWANPHRQCCSLTWQSLQH